MVASPALLSLGQICPTLLDFLGPRQNTWNRRAEVLFRNDIHHVMKSVMKSLKCKQCRERFKPPNRGRRPRYCSVACRQKAYRKRVANPFYQSLKAMSSDLYSIKDLTARERGAVKVLEEMGYEVELRRSGQLPPKKKRGSFLRVVPEDD